MIGDECTLKQASDNNSVLAKVATSKSARGLRTRHLESHAAWALRRK